MTPGGDTRKSSVIGSEAAQSSLSMQLLVNPLRQGAIDPLNLGEVVHAGCEQPAQPAEAGEQLLAALGAHARDAFQGRGRPRLAAPGAVALDREAMRLVADLLNEVERGVIP